jgi:hypothetical protein
MFCRKRTFEFAAHLVEIFFTVDSDRTSRVLFKRSFAADDRSEPEIAVAIEKLHQHLFMISAQTNNSFRIFAAHSDNVFDAAGRIGATVD